MIRLLQRLARAVRHAPGLRSADRLWDAVRPLYHHAINGLGNGVLIRCGPLTLRVPAEFGGLGLDGYEDEAVSRFVRWVRNNPACEVLDVGCSIGLVSHAALAASPQAVVWAMESDLTSLALVERFCRHAPGPQRVRRVRGLLAAETADPVDLETAAARTGEQLAHLNGPARLRDIRFVCLDGTNEKTVPVFTLDALTAGRSDSRPVVLKIDVEGAELLVLRGADRFVREQAPTLLVSVHPTMTTRFGYAAADVRTWLADQGYAIKLLSADHEEHWWCTPTAGSRAR